MATSRTIDAYTDDELLHFGYDDDEPHAESEDEERTNNIVFSSFIVMGAFMALVILFFSKAHERAKKREKESNQVSREEQLKKNLTCKPWSPNNDDGTAETVVSRDTAISMGSFEEESCSSEDDQKDVEQQQQEEGEDAKSETEIRAGCKDGSVCAICNEEYQAGQPVYESNNPLCKHQHHQKCMDKWLECQNTCPICNQAFVLQTV